MTSRVHPAAFMFAVSALLGGCYPETTPSVDNDTWRWFPLDGERSWIYESTNTSLPYRIVASKDNTSEAFGDSTTTRIHTITFGYECLGVSAPCDVDADEDDVPDLETETAMVWKLSSDSSKGALFHAWGDTTFDPPVKIAAASMFADEVVTTESGGITYTSTFTEQGVCDAPFWRGSAPEDCITFTIEASAASPLAGTLQTIFQFGTTSFALDGETQPWRLVDYEDDI